MNGWFSFSRMVRSTEGELGEELTLDVFGLVLADYHVFFKRADVNHYLLNGQILRVKYSFK